MTEGRAPSRPKNNSQVAAIDLNRQTESRGKMAVSVNRRYQCPKNYGTSQRHRGRPSIAIVGTPIVSHLI
jgi:hypothetical protein